MDTPASRRAELERAIRGAAEEGQGFVIVPAPEHLGADYDEGTKKVYLHFTLVIK